MLGVPGASESGREAICVIDEGSPGRLLRAARRHLRSAPQTRSAVVSWAMALGGAPALFTTVTQGISSSVLVTALLMLPVGYLLAWLVVWLSVERNLRAHIRREFQPGRMLGLTVGSHSVRVRDHNSSYEFTYEVLKRVDQYRDVVVLGLGERFVLLPMELLDPGLLATLRSRSGRRTPTQPHPT
jgi:hypothetical protein